jgi:hypothetical protein
MLRGTHLNAANKQIDRPRRAEGPASQEQVQLAENKGVHRQSGHLN